MEIVDTTTAVVQLLEYIIDNLDEGCIATSILLDFSKAFDWNMAY